jgi:hypothetical protein
MRRQLYLKTQFITQETFVYRAGSICKAKGLGKRQATGTNVNEAVVRSPRKSPRGDARKLNTPLSKVQRFCENVTFLKLQESS